MSSAALWVTTPQADRIMPLRHSHPQPHTCDGSPQTRKGLCSWIKWKAQRWEKLWGHPGARSHCTGPHQRRRRVRAGDWRTEAAELRGPRATCRHLQRLEKAGSGFLRIWCLTLPRRGAHCRTGPGPIHDVEGTARAFSLKVWKDHKVEIDENLPHLIQTPTSAPQQHHAWWDTCTFVPKTSKTAISTLSLLSRRQSGEEWKETRRSTWKRLVIKWVLFSSNMTAYLEKHLRKSSKHCCKPKENFVGWLHSEIKHRNHKYK